RIALLDLLRAPGRLLLPPSLDGDRGLAREPREQRDENTDPHEDDEQNPDGKVEPARDVDDALEGLPVVDEEEREAVEDAHREDDEEERADLHGPDFRAAPAPLRAGRRAKKG